jgi:hypothetical protein
MDYDAILMSPIIYPVSKKGHVAIGLIKEGKKGRFSDGQQVRTSLIEERIVLEDGEYIRTLNTVYKVE